MKIAKRMIASHDNSEKLRESTWQIIRDRQNKWESSEKLLESMKTIKEYGWATISEDYHGCSDTSFVYILADTDDQYWVQFDLNGGKAIAKLASKPKIPKSIPRSWQKQPVDTDDLYVTEFTTEVLKTQILMETFASNV